MGWTEQKQEEFKSLIDEYGCLFILGDMDTGKTSVVKHSNKLTDPTPFKKRYIDIPPHQYEEVRKHLQEMLDIGGIFWVK